MMIRTAVLALSLVATLAACDKGPKTQPAVTAAPVELVAAPAGAVAAPAGAVPASVAGEKFGAGVSLVESMPIDQLLADPKAMVGKSVRVEGLVVDVCPKRGCWMDVAGTAAGQKVRFKVADGEMTFPVDAKGKYAVVEGVVAVNELTLEETKEYVAYQQKEYGASAKPEDVTGPMSIVRLDGTGALIRDRQ